MSWGIYHDTLKCCFLGAAVVKKTRHPPRSLLGSLFVAAWANRDLKAAGRIIAQWLLLVTWAVP